MSTQWASVHPLLNSSSTPPRCWRMTRARRTLVRQSLLYALVSPMQSCQRCHLSNGDCSLNRPRACQTTPSPQRRWAPHNRSKPCRFTLLSSVICTRITSWVCLLAIKRLTNTYKPRNQRKVNASLLVRNGFTADPYKRVTRCKPWSSYCHQHRWLITAQLS